MKWRVALAFWLIIALEGCAYVGVPMTNDPMKKLHQGEAVQKMGRYIPAEELGLDALRLAKERGDINAQANAHRYLGNFYKSPLYHAHAEWFESVDRYDPTYELSESHFKKAQSLWAADNDQWGVASEQFNLGTVASLQGNPDEACALYEQSIETYSGAVVAGAAHPWNPNHKDFSSMVTAFARHEGCAFASGTK